MIYWQRRFKFYVRLIAITIAVSFLYQDVVLAQGHTSLQSPTTSLQSPTTSLQLIENINIPSGLGRISEQYKGTNGKTIIHIVDTHGDYFVQKNYAEILKNLTGQVGDDGQRVLLAIEGASGRIDPALFKAIPDISIKRKISDHFLKKGYLTGAEYFSIFSDSNNFIFWGVDDRELYMKNYELFQEVYGFRERMGEFIKGMTDVLDRVEPAILNSEQKEFLDKLKAYHNHKLAITEYCRILKKYRKGLKGFPNVSTLLKAVRIDKQIDYEKIENERAGLIEKLKTNLVKEDLEELIEKSLFFKAGKIDSLEYYKYLLGLASVPRNDGLYENLYLYCNLLKLYSKIRQKDLIIELDNLEVEVREQLFTSPQQKELARIQYDLIILQNLVDLELTREGWEYYIQHREEFLPQEIHRMVQGLVGQGLGVKGQGLPLPPEDGVEMSLLESYFRTVLDRDRALLENTLAKMEDEGINTAILIAGGFHTEGITEQLKEHNASYAVISPKGSGSCYDSPYLSVMLNKLSLFEQLITQYGKRLIQCVLTAVDIFPAGEARRELVEQELPILIALVAISGFRDKIKKGNVKEVQDSVYKILDEMAKIVSSSDIKAVLSKKVIDFTKIEYDSSNNRIKVPLTINGEQKIAELLDGEVSIDIKLQQEVFDVIRDLGIIISSPIDTQINELIKRFNLGIADDETRKRVRESLLKLARAFTAEAVIDICSHPQERNDLRRYLMKDELLPSLKNMEEAIENKDKAILAFKKHPVEFIEEIQKQKAIFLAKLFAGLLHDLGVLDDISYLLYSLTGPEGLIDGDKIPDSHKSFIQQTQKMIDSYRNLRDKYKEEGKFKALLRDSEKADVSDADINSLFGDWQELLNITGEEIFKESNIENFIKYVKNTIDNEALKAIGEIPDQMPDSIKTFIFNVKTVDDVFNGRPVEKESVSLEDTVIKVLEKEKCSGIFDLEGIEGLSLVTNPFLLRRILVNLVRNAHDYRIKDTKAVIKAVVEGDKIILQVRNKGKFPEHILKGEYFEFGGKGEDSEGSGIGGWNVGVFCKALGWDVKIFNDEAKGEAVVEIRISVKEDKTEMEECVLKEVSILDKMPAGKLLSALNLPDPENIPGAELIEKREEYGLVRRRIRIPPRLDRFKPPRGLEVLQNELADTRNIDFTTFDLLYNNKGYLIGVFPVLPQKMEEKFEKLDIRKREEAREIVKADLKYFDFSDYYFVLPKINDPEAMEKWLDFIKERESDKDAIEVYKRVRFKNFANLVNSVHDERAPYVYCEIDKGSGSFRMKYLDLNPKGFILEKFNPDKHQIIIPVFPTVYSTELYISPSLDNWYYNNIYSRLGIKEEDSVLVGEPGTGIDNWFASLKTKKKIYSVGINPLEIANLLATADIGGFEVETVVGDNVISEDGTLAFPNMEFDIVLWNMPSYTTGTCPFKDHHRLKSYSYEDYGGEILKRLARGLPIILKPYGRAMLSNASYCGAVEALLRTAGECDDLCNVKPDRTRLNVEKLKYLYFVSPSEISDYIKVNNLLKKGKIGIVEILDKGELPFNYEQEELIVDLGKKPHSFKEEVVGLMKDSIKKQIVIMQEYLGEEYKEERLKSAGIIKDYYNSYPEELKKLKLPSRVDVDLHMHTYWSDGYQTPTALVFEAWRRGLKAIAITDHETFSGVPEAISAGKIFGVTIVPGIEFRTPEMDIEILVYFKSVDKFMKWYEDTKNKELFERLSQIREKQEKLYFDAIEILFPGKIFTEKEVNVISREGVVFPYHFAYALYEKYEDDFVREGINPIGIFDKIMDFIYKKTNFSKDLISIKDILKWTKDVGAVPVLAHPGKIKGTLEERKKVIFDLFEMGIKGIQIDDQGHTDNDVDFFREITAEYNEQCPYNPVIFTNGSDYHGYYDKERFLGMGSPRHNLINKYGRYEDLLIWFDASEEGRRLTVEEGDFHKDLKRETEELKIDEERDTHPALEKAVEEGRFFAVKGILTHFKNGDDIDNFFNNSPKKMVDKLFGEYIIGFNEEIRNKMIENLRNPVVIEKLKTAIKWTRMMMEHYLILDQDSVHLPQEYSNPTLFWPPDIDCNEFRYCFILDSESKPFIFYKLDSKGEPASVMDHSGIKYNYNSFYLPLSLTENKHVFRDVFLHAYRDWKWKKHIDLKDEVREGRLRELDREEIERFWDERLKIAEKYRAERFRYYYSSIFSNLIELEKELLEKLAKDPRVKKGAEFFIQTDTDRQNLMQAMAHYDVLSDLGVAPTMIVVNDFKKTRRYKNPALKVYGDNVFSFTRGKGSQKLENIFDYDSELKQSAKKLITESFPILNEEEKRNKVMVIITNPFQDGFDIAGAVFDALEGIGKAPIVLVQPDKTEEDYMEKGVVEVLKKAPRFVYIAVKNKIGQDKEALEKKCYEYKGKLLPRIIEFIAKTKRSYILASPEITKKIFKRYGRCDLSKLQERAKKLEQLLTHAVSAHLTCKLGSNLEIKMDGRKPILDIGKAILGETPNIPGGEVFISPENDGVTGKVIFNKLGTGLKGTVKIDRPVTIEVENGYIKRDGDGKPMITGGKAAEILLRDLKSVEKDIEEMVKRGELTKEEGEEYLKNVYHIGEFAIPINEQALISSSLLEVEKVMHTIHLAIGYNYDLDAMTVNHFDWVLDEADVVLRMKDGEEITVMKDGKLLIDEITDEQIDSLVNKYDDGKKHLDIDSDRASIYRLMWDFCYGEISKEDLDKITIEGTVKEGMEYIYHYYHARIGQTDSDNPGSNVRFSFREWNERKIFIVTVIDNMGKSQTREFEICKSSIKGKEKPKTIITLVRFKEKEEEDFCRFIEKIKSRKVLSLPKDIMDINSLFWAIMGGKIDDLEGLPKIKIDTRGKIRSGSVLLDSLIKLAGINLDRLRGEQIYLVFNNEEGMCFLEFCGKDELLGKIKIFPLTSAEKEEIEKNIFITAIQSANGKPYVAGPKLGLSGEVFWRKVMNYSEGDKDFKARLDFYISKDLQWFRFLMAVWKASSELRRCEDFVKRGLKKWSIQNPKRAETFKKYLGKYLDKKAVKYLDRDSLLDQFIARFMYFIELVNEVDAKTSVQLLQALRGFVERYNEGATKKDIGALKLIFANCQGIYSGIPGIVKSRREAEKILLKELYPDKKIEDLPHVQQQELLFKALLDFVKQEKSETIGGINKKLKDYGWVIVTDNVKGGYRVGLENILLLELRLLLDRLEKLSPKKIELPQIEKKSEMQAVLDTEEIGPVSLSAHIEERLNNLKEIGEIPEENISILIRLFEDKGKSEEIYNALAGILSKWHNALKVIPYNELQKVYLYYLNNPDYALKYLYSLISKYLPRRDGYIRKGYKAWQRFKDKVERGEFGKFNDTELIDRVIVDIERRVDLRSDWELELCRGIIEIEREDPEMEGISFEEITDNLKKVPKLLKEMRDNESIYGFNAGWFVYRKDDYIVGHGTGREVYLAGDIISGIQKLKFSIFDEDIDINLDILISEYIFHEILCPLLAKLLGDYKKAHRLARMIQKIVYTENYPGLLRFFDELRLKYRNEGILREIFKEFIYKLVGYDTKILRIYKEIRDIPYFTYSGLLLPKEPVSYFQNIIDRYGASSCIDKHVVLAERLKAECGINPSDIKFLAVPFNWGCLEADYPQSIRTSIESLKGFPIYHLSLLVRINGNWQIMDATFDTALERYGFKVNDWDLYRGTDLASPLPEGISKEVIFEALVNNNLETVINTEGLFIFNSFKEFSEFFVENRKCMNREKRKEYLKLNIKINAWLSELRVVDFIDYLSEISKNWLSENQKGKLKNLKPGEVLEIDEKEDNTIETISEGYLFIDEMLKQKHLIKAFNETENLRYLFRLFENERMEMVFGLYIITKLLTICNEDRDGLAILKENLIKEIRDRKLLSLILKLLSPEESFYIKGSAMNVFEMIVLGTELFRSPDETAQMFIENFNNIISLLDMRLDNKFKIKILNYINMMLIIGCDEYMDKIVYKLMSKEILRKIVYLLKEEDLDLRNTTEDFLGLLSGRLDPELSEKLNQLIQNFEEHRVIEIISVNTRRKIKEVKEDISGIREILAKIAEKRIYKITHQKLNNVDLTVIQFAFGSNVFAFSYKVNGEIKHTLIDTGHIVHQEYILDVLKEAGIHVKNIERILITHSHYDHLGNIKKIADASGAKVYAHPNVIMKMQERLKGKDIVESNVMSFYKGVCGYDEAEVIEYLNPLTPPSHDSDVTSECPGGEGVRRTGEGGCFKPMQKFKIGDLELEVLEGLASQNVLTDTTKAHDYGSVYYSINFMDMGGRKRRILFPGDNLLNSFPHQQAEMIGDEKFVQEILWLWEKYYWEYGSAIKKYVNDFNELDTQDFEEKELIKNSDYTEVFPSHGKPFPATRLVEIVNNGDVVGMNQFFDFMIKERGYYLNDIFPILLWQYETLRITRKSRSRKEMFLNGLREIIMSEILNINYKTQIKQVIEFIEKGDSPLFQGKPILAVFDVHGTLLQPNWKDVYKKTYKELTGKDPSQEWFEKHIVHKQDDYIIDVLSEVSDKPKELVRETLEKMRRVVQETEIPPPMPDALDLVKSMSSRGVPIIAISGSIRDLIMRQLKETGFLEYIPSENIVGRYVDDKGHYDRAKVIEALKAHYPNHMMAYFDDAVSGIKRVKEIGGICFAVPQGDGEEFNKNHSELIKAGAHYILHGWDGWQEIDRLLTVPPGVQNRDEKIPVASGLAKEIVTVLPAPRHNHIGLHIDVSDDLKWITYSYVVDDSGVFKKDGTVDYNALKLEKFVRVPSSYLITPQRYLENNLPAEYRDSLLELLSQGRRYTRYKGITTSWDITTDKDVWTTNIDTVFLHKIIDELYILDNPHIESVIEIGVGGGHLSSVLSSRLPNLKQISITDISIYALRTAKRCIETYLKKETNLKSYLGKGIREVEGSADLILVNPPYIPTPPFIGRDDEDPYRGTGLIREILGVGVQKLNPSNPDASILINISSLAKKDLERYIEEFGDGFVIEPVGDALKVPLKIRAITDEWKEWLIQQGGLEFRKDARPDEEPYWHTLQVYRIRAKAPAPVSIQDVVNELERYIKGDSSVKRPILVGFGFNSRVLSKEELKEKIQEILPLVLAQANLQEDTPLLVFEKTNDGRLRITKTKEVYRLLCLDPEEEKQLRDAFEKGLGIKFIDFFPVFYLWWIKKKLNLETEQLVKLIKIVLDRAGCLMKQENRGLTPIVEHDDAVITHFSHFVDCWFDLGFGRDKAKIEVIKKICQNEEITEEEERLFDSMMYEIIERIYPICYTPLQVGKGPFIKNEESLVGTKSEHKPVPKEDRRITGQRLEGLVKAVFEICEKNGFPCPTMELLKELAGLKAEFAIQGHIDRINTGLLVNPLEVGTVSLTEEQVNTIREILTRRKIRYFHEVQNGKYSLWGFDNFKDIEPARSEEEILSHMAVNAYIKENIPIRLSKAIEEAIRKGEISDMPFERYKILKKFIDRGSFCVVNDKKSELFNVPVIPIQRLFESTGQFGHFGLGQYFGIPVVYIDKDLYDLKKNRGYTTEEKWTVINHELSEIAKWEDFRKNTLGKILKRIVLPCEMRGWIVKAIEYRKTGITAEPEDMRADKMERSYFYDPRGLLKLFHDQTNKEYDVESICKKYARFRNLDLIKKMNKLYPDKREDINFRAGNGDESLDEVSGVLVHGKYGLINAIRLADGSILVIFENYSADGVIRELQDYSVNIVNCLLDYLIEEPEGVRIIPIFTDKIETEIKTRYVEKRKKGHYIRKEVEDKRNVSSLGFRKEHRSVIENLLKGIIRKEFKLDVEIEGPIIIRARVDAPPGEGLHDKLDEKISQLILKAEQKAELKISAETEEKKIIEEHEVSKTKKADTVSSEKVQPEEIGGGIEGKGEKTEKEEISVRNVVERLIRENKIDLGRLDIDEFVEWVNKYKKYLEENENKPPILREFEAYSDIPYAKLYYHKNNLNIVFLALQWPEIKKGERGRRKKERKAKEKGWELGIIRDVDKETGHFLINEIVKNKLIGDKTKEPFQYLDETVVMRKRWISIYFGGNIYTQKEIEKRFGKSPVPIRVRVVFDNDYEWIIEVFKIDPKTKENITLKPRAVYMMEKNEKGKIEFHLIDPSEQSILDSIKEKDNISGEKIKPRPLPENRLSAGYGGLIVSTMAGSGKFKQKDLILYPFELESEGAGYPCLRFGYINIYSVKIKKNTFYRIEPFWHEDEERWLFFVYELDREGGRKVKDEPVLVISGEGKGENADLYVVNDYLYGYLEFLKRGEPELYPGPEEILSPEQGNNMIQDLIKKWAFYKKGQPVYPFLRKISYPVRSTEKGARKYIYGFYFSDIEIPEGKKYHLIKLGIKGLEKEEEVVIVPEFDEDYGIYFKIYRTRETGISEIKGKEPYSMFRFVKDSEGNVGMEEFNPVEQSIIDSVSGVKNFKGEDIIPRIDKIKDNMVRWPIFQRLLSEMVRQKRIKDKGFLIFASECTIEKDKKTSELYIYKVYLPNGKTQAFTITGDLWREIDQVKIIPLFIPQTGWVFKVYRIDKEKGSGENFIIAFGMKLEKAGEMYALSIYQIPEVLHEFVIKYTDIWSMIKEIDKKIEEAEIVEEKMLLLLEKDILINIILKACPEDMKMRWDRMSFILGANSADLIKEIMAHLEYKYGSNLEKMAEEMGFSKASAEYYRYTLKSYKRYEKVEPSVLFIDNLLDKIKKDEDKDVELALSVLDKAKEIIKKYEVPDLAERFKGAKDYLDKVKEELSLIKKGSKQIEDEAILKEVTSWVESAFSDFVSKGVALPGRAKIKKELNKDGLDVDSFTVSMVYFTERYFTEIVSPVREKLKEELERKKEKIKQDESKRRRIIMKYLKELSESVVNRKRRDIYASLTTRYYKDYRSFFLRNKDRFNRMFKDILGYEIDYDIDIMRQVDKTKIGDWILDETGQKKAPERILVYITKRGYYQLINIDELRILLSDSNALRKGMYYWLCFSEENDGKDKYVSVFNVKWMSNDLGEEQQRYKLVDNGQIMAQRLMIEGEIKETGRSPERMIVSKEEKDELQIGKKSYKKEDIEKGNLVKGDIDLFIKTILRSDINERRYILSALKWCNNKDSISYIQWRLDNILNNSLTGAEPLEIDVVMDILDYLYSVDILLESLYETCEKVKEYALMNLEHLWQIASKYIKDKGGILWEEAAEEIDMDEFEFTGKSFFYLKHKNNFNGTKITKILGFSKRCLLTWLMFDYELGNLDVTRAQYLKRGKYSDEDKRLFRKAADEIDAILKDCIANGRIKPETAEMKKYFIEEKKLDVDIHDIGMIYITQRYFTVIAEPLTCISHQ